MTMTPQKKSKLITCIIIAIVAMLFIGISAVIYLYNSGAISYDILLMTSVFLSSAMFLAVIVYAVISYNAISVSSRYEELERMVKEKKE